MSIKRRRIALLVALLAAVLALPLIVQAALTGHTVAQHPKQDPEPVDPAALEELAARTSHRLIVELESDPLAALPSATRSAGKLNVNSPSAQNYIAQLEAEQATFINTLTQNVPNAEVATYLTENGAQTAATYQIAFNGVAVDMGQDVDIFAARDTLLSLPNVKAVYFDYAYDLNTYASLPLINAPAIWSTAGVGGRANAGDGIKFASVDGGIHHDAPMFDGTGWSYPEGYPAGGLGDTQNNNGKIIASRVYFRSWDPPTVGDENSWPGENGTSHGTHTASTAVGNIVQAEYLSSGITETLSGVAPGAWAMSYKVFYPTDSEFSGSAFSVELIAAVEDVVADGADVVNNSWGGGPGSLGGEFDALDMALRNAVDSGVFVSMSAGNAGPGLGTGDHPSDEYINVAASTTSGTYGAGRMDVSAPTPISPTLQDIGYGTAAFGEPLEVGDTASYEYVTAAELEPANVQGCDPFTADFTGKAVVISRGTCDFSQKVYHGQQAGAVFVIIHNNRDGDAIQNMGAGDNAEDVTISSIFISENDGNRVVQWYADKGNTSEITIDTRGFQAGNTPDEIINFSSRGPSAGGLTLKPDIAAPGVNIMAQGYDPVATGEARHLGFGQVSGTSMASPHVAGSAVILRQLHPGWGNAEIKAALMGAAKYTEIYNQDGTPAQPLDMGAGRLDFTHIVSPGVGVILDPPSLSFGYGVTGTQKTMRVQVTSVANVAQTYALSTLFTGDGFTSTTSLQGFSVTPASITLAPGASAMVTVRFNGTGAGFGDNQGYLVLDGATYDSHAPMWARVVPETSDSVLIIDADFSSELGLPDYLSYYTDALDELGMTYEVYDTANGVGMPSTIPSATELAAYKAVIVYTGDNFSPDGTFTVSTALTLLDMDRLTEYANSGGIVIAMGQDLSAVLASDESGGGTFFYSGVLGADWLQDSVSNFNLPSQPVVPMDEAPEAIDSAFVDLSFGRDQVELLGTNEVPTNTSDNTGVATFGYNPETMELSYDVSVSAFTETVAIQVTGAHIHTGTEGVNGGIFYTLVDFTDPTITITGTEVIASGSLTLTADQEETLQDGGYYVNIHTVEYAAGELRGQVPVPGGDGASNQFFVDELRVEPGAGLDGAVGIRPLMRYPHPSNVQDGIVAIEHRDQPTLERPGKSSEVRTIYTSFGLEGVNNGVATDRHELLAAFMNMLLEEPMVTISDTTESFSESGQTMRFTAEFSSNISDTVAASYRWDFGDGSGYTTALDDSDTVVHTYEFCGPYTVRVEATSEWGNKVIATEHINATQGCTTRILLPLMLSGASQ